MYQNETVFCVGYNLTAASGTKIRQGEVRQEYKGQEREHKTC